MSQNPNTTIPYSYEEVGETATARQPSNTTPLIAIRGHQVFRINAGAQGSVDVETSSSGQMASTSSSSSHPIKIGAVRAMTQQLGAQRLVVSSANTTATSSSTTRSNYPSSPLKQAPVQVVIRAGASSQSGAAGGYSSGGDISGPSVYRHIAPVQTTGGSYGGHRPWIASNLTKRKAGGHSSGHRKPCNCTRSGCLKLYCECFANGEFCKNCNCKDCQNNLAHEASRSKAIKSTLERNPNAFMPKIGKGRSDIERLHQKGCNCKKSNCLKNYCECYEAKVPCTARCKCVACRNSEFDRQSKGGGGGMAGGGYSLSGRYPDGRALSGAAGLLHLAAAAASASGDAGGTTTGGGGGGGRSASPTPYSEDGSDGANAEQVDPKCMPWYYMTDEVVEATALCLVAQAEEMERVRDATNTPIDPDDVEREILNEFGRCLEQIIDNAVYATQPISIVVNNGSEEGTTVTGAIGVER